MEQQLLLICHALLAVGIISLVLIQHGKGADVGAAFGSGASNTVFGSRGSGSFLTRLTTVLALLFAVTSISLSLVNKPSQGPKTISERLEQQEIPAAVESKTTDNDLPQLPVEE